jgi:hypothetical protein
VGMRSNNHDVFFVCVADTNRVLVCGRRRRVDQTQHNCLCLRLHDCRNRCGSAGYRWWNGPGTYDAANGYETRCHGRNIDFYDSVYIICNNNAVSASWITPMGLWFVVLNSSLCAFEPFLHLTDQMFVHFTTALWYGFIGFIGGLIGQGLVERMIKKFGRPSLVIFLLTFVIAISGLVMAIMGAVDAANALRDKNWSEFGFHSLC